MIRAKWRLVWLVAALAGLGVIAACSPKNALVPQLPPETTVFVQGPVDTVSYKVHLYWFGSDADGYVVAYELRFKNPAAPADTAWIRTARTDSLFDVYTPTGVSEPIFEVRAIDDDGLTDPTPARQDFTFRNLPPTLSIVSGPGLNDTTFASVTVVWSASDPDGDIAHASYRVWLDGHEADPILTTATHFTMPTDQFRQGGQLLSGRRKLYVVAIDDAGFATPPESLSWIVRAPVTGNRARLLIVDDVPGNTGPQLRNDTLFTETARRNLPDGTWSVLRLELTQPFRSTADLEQTFELFEAVIWYRGAEGQASSLLTNYRDGLGRYLESGGKFFIESQQLIAGQGGLGVFPEDWVSRYFGSDFLYRHVTNVPGDSSVAWGIAGADSLGNPTILRSTVFSDSLQEQSIYGELRGFAVRDTGYVAVWARRGSLTQPHDYDIPVGVSVPQPGGGRLVAITFPLRTANLLNTVPRFLAKVFEQMELVGP